MQEFEVKGVLTGLIELLQSNKRRQPKAALPLVFVAGYLRNGEMVFSPPEMLEEYGSKVNMIRVITLITSLTPCDFAVLSYEAWVVVRKDIPSPAEVAAAGGVRGMPDRKEVIGVRLKCANGRGYGVHQEIDAEGLLVGELVWLGFGERGMEEGHDRLLDAAVYRK